MDPTCSASSGPTGLVVQVYCFPGVRAAVMDNLNRQREEGRLCDLSIQVQGQVFRAHRCVLAASSPYFHDQVLLKNVTTVSLPSVMDPVAFESVLSSAYTGQLSILHDDIVNYVTVASFLQMWHIVDKCTEILKRPRPPPESNTGDVAATHHGTTSRQQSPSSTDCLYVEREGRRRERKPDALPPLATWRRPQEFPRWGRPRPSPAHHLADSQLDALPGCGESDYSSCEEVWQSSHAKSSPFGHDVHSHSSSGRPHGGFSGGEALRQRARYHHRGPGPSSERPLSKDRENTESDETQERRRNEKRGIEADEGIGEEVSEKKEGLVQTGPPGHFQPGGGNQSEEAGPAVGKVSAENMKEKEEEEEEEETGDVAPTSDMAALHPCETDESGVPGPSCPLPASSTRTPWQAGPWSQQGARPQDREEVSYRKDEEEEEEDVDFGRFADGAFGGDTYDEIEDGTGQVSQRPLVPVSPDESDFSMGASEISWPSTSMGPARALTPSSSRHLSPSSAPFPPSSSSPPTPSSSSSLSLAGTPYTGKVHFCHCGKAYTLKSMRDRHVKMQHLNLRPFGCPVCAKSFKMKHHLTKHLKTHGGLRPYECNLCGKKVIWRDSFLRHQARCERLAASSSAGSDTAATAMAVDDGYGYGFDEGETFLAAGGQVKVEQVDFHGDMEDGMGGLLGSVPGIVDELGTQPRSLNCQVFKQEASESFS